MGIRSQWERKREDPVSLPLGGIPNLGVIRDYSRIQTVKSPLFRENEGHIRLKIYTGGYKGRLGDLYYSVVRVLVHFNIPFP